MSFSVETIRRFGLRLVLASVIVAASFSAVLAQKAAEDTRLQTRELNSKSLERAVPYNVIVPITYGDREHAGKRYPVIYLLHGLMGHFDNWAKMTNLQEYSREYDFIIVMPEGNDGFYTNAENVPADRYEDYLIRDLIPDVEKNYRTRTDRNGRIIAGLSMGGYGAIKYGLKYPDKFVLAGSFSGALGAARTDLKVIGTGWKALSDAITAVYGEMGSRTRKENDLYTLIEGLAADDIEELPFLYIDCGTEDFLIGDNRSFATKLFERKIPHEFRQLPGMHDWKYWDKQVQEFLKLADGFAKNN